MLRLLIIVVAGLVFACALVLAFVEPAVRVWPTVVAAGVIFAGVLFERYVYKPLRSGPPGAGWAPTGERFIDPTSNRPVRVFVRSADGKRVYVADVEG